MLRSLVGSEMCIRDRDTRYIRTWYVYQHFLFDPSVRCYSTLRAWLLDVLTPLSDCRQEPVEKMARRISGVSYMYWMDFYNEIFCCGFLCARLISVSFSESLFRLARRGLPRPTAALFRLPRRGLPRPYICVQANRLPRLQGYHTRATTLQINFWVQAGYHTCG